MTADETPWSELDPEQLVDARRVGDHMGVTDRAVRMWAASGDLPCVRFSFRGIRFRVADVNAFVASRSKGAA